MRHLALTVIRQEHMALAAMLRSLTLLLGQARRERALPDFGVVRAMLLYVDEFPEKLHHPNESRLLFPRLRTRAPELVPTLDRLEADHARGEAAIRELEHALLAFEVLGEPRREAFEHAAEQYVAAYLTHMSIEESQVLPALEAHFTDADWAEVDSAFGAHRDPLTGHPAEPQYERLFAKIVSTAPAPIGLG